MSVHIDTRKIIKEWIDYNGHMNMAYYVLIFDQAWENILNKFQMGGEKAEESKRTTMVVETRTTYDSEVKEGDEVEVYVSYFDHDKKRLHLKCEMYEKKTKKLSATMENLSLYIDLDKRKVTEFEDEKVKIMDEFIDKNKVDFKIENLMFKEKLKK
jgi:acyl-CoA thioester hydrolase|tara:strand:+ start:1597 stop:2064 length:468 start_codon:yes stop_codon:yes gene_type:complete